MTIPVRSYQWSKSEAAPLLSVSATVQERWRQTGSDAVYVQPYAPIVATLGNQARRVGEGIASTGRGEPIAT